MRFSFLFAASRDVQRDDRTVSVVHSGGSFYSLHRETYSVTSLWPSRPTTATSRFYSLHRETYSVTPA